LTKEPEEGKKFDPPPGKAIDIGFGHQIDCKKHPNEKIITEDLITKEPRCRTCLVELKQSDKNPVQKQPRINSK